MFDPQKLLEQFLGQGGGSTHPQDGQTKAGLSTDS